MSMHAKAMFAIKSWDEKAYNEVEGMPKLARSSVVKTFTGDIEGESQLEYLMMYRADGTATFVGLERIVGRLEGKSGSFVLQRSGIFDGTVARESYTIIQGSGTAELASLRGQGSSVAGHAKENPMELEYDLDDRK